MKRIRLKVAYDGTDFHGFQKLPELRTVEGILEDALCELCREPVELIGASRTDSGVHSRGNVAVFDTESSIPPDRFCYALDQKLPPDLRVIASEACAADWHPRKQKAIKTYEYSIYNGRIEDPLLRRYAWHCPYPLDTEAMREALLQLVGSHDFTAFSNPASQILQRGGSAERACLRRGPRTHKAQDKGRRLSLSHGEDNHRHGHGDRDRGKGAGRYQRYTELKGQEKSRYDGSCKGAMPDVDRLCSRGRDLTGNRMET